MLNLLRISTESRYTLWIIFASAYMTVAPAAIIFFDGPNMAYAMRIFISVLLNVCFITGIFVLIQSTRIKYLRTGFHLLAQVFFALYVYVTFYYILLYGQMPGIAAISAVIDSNSEEAVGFFRSVFTIRRFLFALALSSPVIFALRARCNQLDMSYYSRLSLCCFILASLAPGVRFPSIAAYNPILFVWNDVREAIHSKQEIREASVRFRNADFGPIVNRETRPRVHVLVLGEALTRRRMSLYGYSRRTNPLLEQIRNDLFVYADACSSRGATVPSLKELLSFATREDGSLLYTAPNLISVMKAAGYKTFWISNQQRIGFYDSWSGIFADTSDAPIFVNKGGWRGLSYDEKLFEPFNAALDDPTPNKFIIVHLLGSHSPYELRYPDEYSLFTSSPEGHLRLAGIFSRDFWKGRSNVADAYDNSVLYNDFVLHELVTRLDRSNGDTLTYLSDHGETLEDLGEFLGHYDGPGPRSMYEIPLIFHLGHAFRKDHPDLLDRMEISLDKKFQSDHLIHTLLDMYNIDAPELRPDRSLFSKVTEEVARYCDTLTP